MHNRYAKAAELKGKPLVGSRQHFAGAPSTANWRQQETVVGKQTLKAGTAPHQDLICKQFWLMYVAATMALTVRAESSPKCPTAIQPESIQLKVIPAGWASYVAAPLYLHSAVPMDGSADQLGELAGFKQEKIPGGWRHRYDLNMSFPKGKWLVCRYGESGQVTLSRQLDDSIRTCSFSYGKGEHVGENRIAITCK